MAALEAASLLGVHNTRMGEALAAARARDAAMAQQLRELAGAPIRAAAPAAGDQEEDPEPDLPGSPRSPSRDSSRSSRGGSLDGSSPGAAGVQGVGEGSALMAIQDAASDEAAALAQPPLPEVKYYDPAEFAALASLALGLGLRGDVAAAKVRAAAVHNVVCVG